MVNDVISAPHVIKWSWQITGLTKFTGKFDSGCALDETALRFKALTRDISSCFWDASNSFQIKRKLEMIAQHKRQM